MTGYRSIYRLVIPIFAVAVFGFLALFSRTALGNLFKKSTYADWASALEDSLLANNADVLLIDFGTLPGNDEDMYIVVKIAEPKYEYDLQKLFMDVHQIIITTYVQSDSVPPMLDYVLVAYEKSSELLLGVRAPFQTVLAYVQGDLDSESYLDSWEYMMNIEE